MANGKAVQAPLIRRITSWMLDKVIREFGCHKDKKQSSKIGLETRYEQYGGKENYFKHLHEINDDNKEKEYGSNSLVNTDREDSG